VLFRSVCCCLMFRNTEMQFVVWEANLGEMEWEEMWQL
jgi:hypothetical protein